MQYLISRTSGTWFWFRLDIKYIYCGAYQTEWMSSVEYRYIRCKLQIGSKHLSRNIYQQSINFPWVISFKRDGDSFLLMTEKFFLQFFPFKCHAASEDRLHTPNAPNRIAYKLCKALFPRMCTRWFAALNVKKSDFPGYYVLMNTAGRLSEGHYIIMLLLS